MRPGLNLDHHVGPGANWGKSFCGIWAVFIPYARGAIAIDPEVVTMLIKLGGAGTLGFGSPGLK